MIHLRAERSRSVFGSDSVGQGHAQAALRAALEMDLFEAFQAQDEVGLDELARKVGAESVLVGMYLCVRYASRSPVMIGFLSDQFCLVRIMRALIAVGFFNQTTDERYALNKVSRRFMHPSFRTLIIGMCVPNRNTVLARASSDTDLWAQVRRLRRLPPQPAGIPGQYLL